MVLLFMIGTYASLMEGFESSGRAAHQDVENRWQNQEYN
jgi:hypothetical protein